MVEEKAIPISSRETCEELGALKIVINSVDEQSSLFSEFKECFEGVGKLRDFKAKLHIDDTVKPVAQRQRPVPYGVRQKVEKKLEELVNADIIEPVTGPTPWVRPVVEVLTFYVQKMMVRSGHCLLRLPNFVTKSFLILLPLNRTASVNFLALLGLCTGTIHGSRFMSCLWIAM